MRKIREEERDRLLNEWARSLLERRLNKFL